MPGARRALTTLAKRADFLRVAGRGTKWATAGLVLQACPRSAERAPGAGQSGANVSEAQAIRVGYTASKKVGGAVVRNRYASREFGMIASDCPQGGGLHLMDMRLWVETNPPQATEAPGELILTDLDNHPMPMIRYRIDDTGRFTSGPCSCGRPWTKLASVDGRVLDVIVTPDGRAFGGTFFTLTLRPYDRSIAQFQVIQDRVDHLVVKIVPGHAWDLRRRAELLETLNRQLGGGLQIELLEVSEIPPLPSGKRRFVVSQIEPQGKATTV